MIRLHPRMQQVRLARGEISEAVMDIAKDRSLTMIETVGILTEVAQEWCRHLLRAERHPDDPEKKADEA